MANIVKGILLFTTLLFALNGAVESIGCSPACASRPVPRIIAAPASQLVNYTSPLRMICVAYVGSDTERPPDSLAWFTERNELIINSSQITIYNTILMRQDQVFVESILEACSVNSYLIGQLSCRVSSVGGEDNARWNITYDIAPPVIIVNKPTIQVVDYTTTLRMNCTALVLNEIASDSNITWWVGPNLVYNSSETTIYTRRVRNGNMLYVQSMLTILSVSYLYLGEFTCRAENSLGRDIAWWTVTTPIAYPAPSLTVTPATTLVNFRDTVSARCTANVGPQATYNVDRSTIMWLDAYGKTIPPTTNQIYITNSMSIIEGDVILESTLLINGIDFQHVGYLVCQVENAFGAGYATIYVDTYETLTAPQLLVAPANQTVDCRSRVTLACVVNAFPTPDIWWTFNDIYIDNETSNNVNILESGVNGFRFNFSESYLDICGLEQIGHYKCIASNTLGNITSSPVLVDIDLDAVPPVIPPTVTRKDRTSANEAIVVFEPQSLGSFEVTYYVANDSTTPYLIESIDSLQVTAEQPQVTLTGLDICSRYWVVITALYCTRSSNTQPIFIDFYSLAQYELTVTLGSKDRTCNTWVIEDPETKARDMETGLLSPVSACGFSIPCFDQSTWECTNEDQMKVTFKTQLVGHNSETAGQIKKCIDDWIAAGSAKGQAFAVAGSNLTVVDFTPLEPARSALPVWVWVVVAIGGALLIAFLVTAVFLFAMCTKYKQSASAFSKKERLVGSNDAEANDYTEVAVVDNPLYGENEGDVEAYLKEDLAAKHEEDEINKDEEPNDDNPKKTEI